MTKITRNNIVENLKFVAEENDSQTIFEFGDNKSFGENIVSSITLKPNSGLTYICALFGGEKVQKNIDIELREGASVNFIGIFLGADSENHKIEVRVRHVGSRSSSRLTVKGILKDRAKNSFRGLITVAENAQKSTGHLEQHILLLGNDAKADGRPELEVLTDDVTASHAATMGRINEEQLFYMTSRGIPSETAKAMIVRGFLESLIKEIDEEEIKIQLEKSLRKYV